MRLITTLGTLLTLALVLGCNDSNDDSGPSGPWVAPATSLCDKAGQCSGGELSSSEMNQCLDLVKPTFAILPDPDSFENCVLGLDCATLQNDETAITDCLDINTDTMACVGSDALHACTNAGVCKDIDCSDACKLMDGTAVGCGIGDEGWANCLCQV
jgi:hypothetical protein